MAKDPAFLFYPGDWLGGTMGMTIEQKGAYMELLIYQFNNGKFTEISAKQVLSICLANAWDNIKHKFQTDGKLFWNARLETEILRRKSFSESRRTNALHSRKTKKNKSKAYAKHMEDENENRNRIKDKYEKKTEIFYPFNSEKFMNLWKIWVKFKKQQFNFKYKPIGEQGALKELSELSKGNEELAIKIIYQSIQKGWKGFFNIQQNGKQPITQSGLADELKRYAATHR